MPVVSAREMLVEAATHGYAVGAFNVTNIIQMEAVIEAAVARRAPVIVQTSVTPTSSRMRRTTNTIPTTSRMPAPAGSPARLCPLPF